MIPLKINNKNLCEIFDPGDYTNWSEAQLTKYMLDNKMFPTEVRLEAETYSRDAERTADYQLESLLLVNRKSKPEFTWSLIKASYVEKLMSFLSYAYDFVSIENEETVVTPKESPIYEITYKDFTGNRTIKSYLGQTINGTLVEYNGELYWENFRISFPER